VFEGAWWEARKGSRARNEIEAESIAYMVLKRLDPEFRMGDYLLGYVKDHETLPTDVGLRTMIQVTTKIIAMGEARLPAPGGRRSKRDQKASSA
jgi:hypothetical protein